MQKQRIVGVIAAAVLAGTQLFGAMPAFAADEAYIYGTVNLPFADYYYGELVDVAIDSTMDLTASDPTAALRADGYCDAVTSATMTKAQSYECTYWENDLDDEGNEVSTTIYGICDVSVAIPTSLYNDALDAIADGQSCNNQLLSIVADFVPNDDQSEPAEYKILNGDGTLTAMYDSVDALVITDAEFEVITNDTYGSYQININNASIDTPEREEMEGVVITMTDGSRYAMLHEDNLWFKTYEIAWSVVSGYTVHGNTLKYLCFEDTVGKTVSEIRYIVRGGADKVYQSEAYLPVLHDGTVTAQSVNLSEGAFSVETANLPDDYDPIFTCDADNASYDNGVITFDGSNMLPGSVTVTVDDASGVYASISTTVELTTDEIPAIFDEITMSIVPADGVDEESFAYYLSQMTKISIDGTSYNLSGRNSKKVIDTTTGALDLTVDVIAEEGVYDIEVIATGYSQNLTFTLVVGDAAVDDAESDDGDADDSDVDTDDDVTEGLLLGDLNGDGNVDAVDAHLTLVAYASAQLADADYGLTEEQFAAADIDGDGVVMPVDAHYILLYYALAQISSDGTASWEDAMAK